MFVTNEKITLLRNRHIGKQIRLGVETYRIGNINRDVYDGTKIEVSLEKMSGFILVYRTTTVLSIPEFYAARVR